MRIPLLLLVILTRGVQLARGTRPRLPLATAIHRHTGQEIENFRSTHPLFLFVCILLFSCCQIHHSFVYPIHSIFLRFRVSFIFFFRYTILTRGVGRLYIFVLSADHYSFYIYANHFNSITFFSQGRPTTMYPQALRI